MPRAPLRRMFRVLPTGVCETSTHPRTVARNQPRRSLDPLQAEYERARANRSNRISSKIKRLKKTAAYINAKTDQHVFMEKVIRDREKSVYQTNRVTIAQEYAEMQAAAVENIDEKMAKSEEVGERENSGEGESEKLGESENLGEGEQMYDELESKFSCVIQ